MPFGNSSHQLAGTVKTDDKSPAAIVSVHDFVPVYQTALWEYDSPVALTARVIALVPSIGTLVLSNTPVDLGYNTVNDAEAVLIALS